MQRGTISLSMCLCGAATAMLAAYTILFPLHTSVHINNTLPAHWQEWLPPSTHPLWLESMQSYDLQYVYT